MNSKDFKKINNILGNDLNNYDNKGFNDEDKMKCCTIISKEADIIRTEEKHKQDLARMKAQQKLEREKFEFEKTKILEDQRIRSKELDIQKEKLENESKQNKRTFIVTLSSTAVSAILAIVSKAIFTGLTLNAQKHDYADFQVESNSSKENRTNLLKN